MIPPHYLAHFTLFCLPWYMWGRSIHRPQEHNVPAVTTRWPGCKETFTLRHSHLQAGPLFHVFEKEHLRAHSLPRGPIPYRYSPDQSVTGVQLSSLIEQLVDELKVGKKEFKHFILLKWRDYNRRNNVGLVIVKFKKYPFVVKLFIETPESFVQPFSKGFEPICFFYMGGGVNRHISGFTRIKNLNDIKNMVQADPYWSKRVDFPRKWFWIPEDNKWFEVTGVHMGDGQPLQTEVPHIYAIVADQIQWVREFSLTTRKDRDTAMALSNFLHQRIDPHINNYGYEKKTGKIVPIDFELFPMVVGLNRDTTSRGYLSWYTGLALKMARDTFGQTKQDRTRMKMKTTVSYWNDE